MTEDIKDRPLVTFALFAYNQEKYIREAVEGAFAQTYKPLEIIISDDASTDRTFKIVSEMVASYDGPHAVRINRNEENLGVSSHFSKIVKMAKSETVVVAAGDDVSFPHRTMASATALRTFPGVNYVELGQIEISDSSTKADILGLQANENEDFVSKFNGARQFALNDYLLHDCPPPSAAGRTIKASSFLRFGDLDSRCPTEDTPSLVRMLLSGDGLWIPVVGLARRKHSEALSGPDSLSRMNFDFILSQYLTDIEAATEQRLIGQKEKTRLQRSVRRVVARRELRRLVGSGQFGVKQLLIELLPSRSLSFRDKGYALKKYILGGGDV